MSNESVLNKKILQLELQVKDTPKLQQLNDLMIQKTLEIGEIKRRVDEQKKVLEDGFQKMLDQASQKVLENNNQHISPLVLSSNDKDKYK